MSFRMIALIVVTATAGIVVVNVFVSAGFQTHENAAHNVSLKYPFNLC
jgi:hypothetical protein